MIPASSYLSTYLIVITIITIFAVIWYILSKRELTKEQIIRDHFVALILAVLMSLFIGFRPVSSKYFVDMSSYAAYYDNLQYENFSFDWDVDNVIFDNMMSYLASSGVSSSSFFLLMSSLYFMMMFIACRKMFPEGSLIPFLFCLAAFSTFSYGTNGIKAGAAASLFLVAIAYREKVFIAILFLILSLGFHHSMQLPVAAFIIILIIRNPKIYFFIWISSLLIALFHITFFQEIFAALTDEQGAGYLITEESDLYWGEVIRFRPDFVLYSSVPVVIGFFLLLKRRVLSDEYKYLLNYYLLTNSIWMLCMYAKFTNRIAYLSWFVYPIVLIYPFLENRRSNPLCRIVPWVVTGHLAFTLFMFFIYY